MCADESIQIGSPVSAEMHVSINATDLNVGSHRLPGKGLLRTGFLGLEFLRQVFANRCCRPYFISAVLAANLLQEWGNSGYACFPSSGKGDVSLEL